jgi:hydroxymethylglutaryl-CoA lyase
VATEDVISMFDRMGIETGIDFDKLVHASDQILKRLARHAPSRARTAYLATKNTGR